jgi:DNA-binding transcriptional MerR regulator
MAWRRSSELTGPERERSPRLTVDELAREAGTTTRQVRALQTQGLLPRPDVVGRTGFYDADHLDRLRAILRLQAEGFSLASLATLFHAWEADVSLGQVLGLGAPAPRVEDDDADVFGNLVERSPARPVRLLSLVPSTILDQAAAS